MCQNWYTNAESDLASVSGEICTCANLVRSFCVNVHSDKLICLLVLNLKMSITKLNRVLFGNPNNNMLRTLKMMPLSIRSSKLQFSYK